MMKKIELNELEFATLKGLVKNSIVEYKECINDAENCGDYEIKKYFEEIVEEYTDLYKKLDL